MDLTFEKPLGWIALDIDGTITSDKYSIPTPVTQYLQSLAEAGWKIVLLTGRSFYFAMRAIEVLPFPFLLVLQNGSLTLKMPNKENLEKNYLGVRQLSFILKEHEGIPGDVLIYAGFEKGDFFYFRPHLFPKEDLPFLEEIKRRENPTSEACLEFDLNKIKEAPLVKAFGSKDRMSKYSERLEKQSVVDVTMIQDQFNKDFYHLLITNLHVTKGNALQSIVDQYGRGKAVICAGDDENDFSMFEVADFSIAMESAPEKMKKKADLIAPPTSEYGIIAALSKAIQKFS